MNESTLTLSFLKDSDKDNWNACVGQSSEGNFFHKYEWLKLLEEGLGLKPFHIVVKKGSNIIGGFPNFVCRFRETPLKVLSSMGRDSISQFNLVPPISHYPGIYLSSWEYV